MPKILLTGFEPWDNWSHNPSGEIAKALDGARIGGYDIVSAVIPVAYGEDIARVRPLMAEHRPLAVVSLGLHGSASSIHVERVAHNLRGRNEEEQPICVEGPAAHFATLDPRAVARAIETEAKVPAELTYFAGTFLCNHIMYCVLHDISQLGYPTRAGFLHLPPTPDMVLGTGRASMAREDTRRAVVAALEAVAATLTSRAG